MLDEDFLHSLPDDPDEAFAILYKGLKANLAREQSEAMMQVGADSAFNLHDERQSLLNIVFAFISAHGMQLDLDRGMPKESQRFHAYFSDVTADIEFYIAKTSFERVVRNKNGVSGIYVLPPALKLEIHHHLSIIRELVISANLTDIKRTALSKKLNAFGEEVDRDRTRIEALASAMIWTRKEIIEGAKGLEPIVKKLDKMFQSMAKATEFIRLPSRDNQKQLPKPPKRIEGPKRDMDDEVPF